MSCYLFFLTSAESEDDRVGVPAKESVDGSFLPGWHLKNLSTIRPNDVANINHPIRSAMKEEYGDFMLNVLASLSPKSFAVA